MVAGGTGRARAVLLALALCSFLALYLLGHREESVVRFTAPEEEGEPLGPLLAGWVGDRRDPRGVPLVDLHCKCCDWQTDLAQRWAALRANKTILLLQSTGGGLGNQFQGWIATAMVSMVLDRAFVLNHHTPGDDEQMSAFFRSRWWPFAPTTQDWEAVEGQQIIKYRTWYPWLQEKGLEAFRSHFPREGPVIIQNDWPALGAILSTPEMVEVVRKTMGGIDRERIVPCLANFLFTSLADRLQLEAKDLLMAIDHSGPGPHSSVSVGVHIRLGDAILLSKYQHAGMHGSSRGDKRPFDPEKTLRCLDGIIESIEGPHARATAAGHTEGTAKKVVLFVAADSTTVYDLFIERYGAQRVVITPGEPYHIARAVDDPQKLDLEAARDKAYIDWFLLSKVDLLVHNFGSSYSITAGRSSLHTRQINSTSCEISMS